MNYSFLLGGFIGFALVFIVTSLTGANWASALRDGMIGCFIVGYLFKVLFGIIERAADEAREQNANEKRQDGQVSEN